jgi:diacylglycerol kinase (ATP)
MPHNSHLNDIAAAKGEIPPGPESVIGNACVVPVRRGRVPRMLIVFNPTAGRRRAGRLWRVLDIMTASGMRLELAETRGPGHATELARDAAASGTDLVVAAGGDGTIAEVANGLSGSGCRLGVIPLGTANVMAHELGLPFVPREVAAALAFGRTRTIRPGIATGAGGTRVFVQMLGVGFDAQVVQRLSLPLKRALGRGAYVAQSLREAARYRFRPIRLRVDGRACEAGSVIVSKGHYYGGCYLLAPGATPAAPGFAVALFDRAGPVAALLYGAALPLNLLPRMPGLRLLRAEEVAIDSGQVPAQTDGDAAGWGPLLVRDAPSAIEVVVGT